MWRKTSRRRNYSYTEFGTNEKGVSVSATETLYGNEKVTEADPYRDAEWAEANKSERIGIEETDIPTIILAEASSAREGVKLLLDIYENYGCVAASGVFVCDKDEVWYVENCSGTQYVAIKLNDNMIFLEPNMAVIGRVDLDDENVIASKDLIAVAKKAGTFVGDEAKNIIDFRASYARISEKMDQRMIDGLNYLNATYKYDSDALVADNTKFTISNLDASDKLVALYTNIKADRKLDKDDVFGYYKLSSIGKASNQEIEIFQLFKNRPVETATVGWVGVGMMLASSLSMIMRIWDGVTDPFVGFMVDKTNGKFGKNRPFIVIGNIILAVTSFVLFHVTHLLPQAVRFPFYVVVLMIYYLGYTCQCVVTKSAQSCMTNDPKQRPMFASFDGVFNTVLFAGLAVVFANMANSY